MARLSLIVLTVLTVSGLIQPSLADECTDLATASINQDGDYPFLITAATQIEQSEDLPAYCRVQGFIAPQIGFELRLPTENWNQKFLMQGCGGLCGIIKIGAADDALARGYAVTTSDMGHKGLPFSGIWAYDNRQAEIDFGYRATHATTVVTRAIAAAYFNAPAQYSYFRGCSTGGRQGMVEAQRYPEDFDGIISGAPVINETGIGALHLLWTVRANLDESRNQILDGAKLPMVRDAVLQKCDALDGVTDGLLSDPRLCDFDPAELLCRPGQASADCLSDADVDVVRKIYGGPKNSKGEQLYPGGLMRGSEYEWAPGLVGLSGQPALGLQMPLISDFLRYMAFDTDPGPDYSLYDFDFDRDPRRLKKMEKIYTGSNPDLSAFKERGGKIIMYQGWDDLEITPTYTVEYYEQIIQRSGSLNEARDFFRLFMLPGVAHCRRGPGPDAIDYLTYLEDWVEDGKAPESMTSAHMVKEQPYDGLPPLRFPLEEGSYDFTRPVYPYPDIATYSGEGDVNDAANWRRKIVSLK